MVVEMVVKTVIYLTTSSWWFKILPELDFSNHQLRNTVAFWHSLRGNQGVPASLVNQRRQFRHGPSENGGFKLQLNGQVTQVTEKWSSKEFKRGFEMIPLSKQWFLVFATFQTPYFDGIALGMIASAHPR